MIANAACCATLFISFFKEEKVNKRNSQCKVFGLNLGLHLTLGGSWVNGISLPSIKDEEAPLRPGCCGFRKRLGKTLFLGLSEPGAKGPVKI